MHEDWPPRPELTAPEALDGLGLDFGGLLDLDGVGGFDGGRGGDGGGGGGGD